MTRRTLPPSRQPPQVSDSVQNRANDILHRRLVELEDRSRETPVAAALGRRLNRQILSGSGVYVPTAGTMTALIRMIAGGGGGGGAGGTSGVAGAGGGHSGWYLDFRVTGASAITGGRYSCGAGGAGGTASNLSGLDGSNGGDTSFTVNGVTYLAKGGAGGGGVTEGAANGSSKTILAQGGSTDVAGLGLGILNFWEGELGLWTATTWWFGGFGGRGPLGPAGQLTNGLQDGITGLRGSGGSGGAGFNGAAQGGAGGAGLIIVDELS